MASRYSKDSDKFYISFQFEGYEFEFKVEANFTAYRGTTLRGGDDPSDKELDSIDILNWNEQIAMAKEYEVEYEMAPLSNIEALRKEVVARAEKYFIHN